jgi:hypothetical protein
MKKEYLLSRGEETHKKECLRLRNHIIFVTIFFPIEFKKMLSTERHRQKVPPFNCLRQDEKFHKSSMR